VESTDHGAAFTCEVCDGFENLKPSSSFTIVSSFHEVFCSSHMLCLFQSADFIFIEQEYTRLKYEIDCMDRVSSFVRMKRDSG